MILALQILVVGTLMMTAWFAPRAFVGIGLVLIVTSPTLANLLPGSGANYLDEVVVVVAVAVLSARRVWARQWPRIPGWSLWFGGFLLAGTISSVLQGVPASIALQGAFLATKGILFGVAVAQVDWHIPDLRRFIVGGAAVTLVIGAFLIPNLLNPPWWSGLFAGAPEGFYSRGEFSALIGPFTDPAALGRLSALLAIGALAYRLCLGGRWISWVVLAVATAGALASIRVKTYVSLLAAALMLGALNIRRLPRWVVVAAGIALVIAAVPLYQFVARDVNLYIFGDSARSRLTLGAVELANSYAPFGAGFGRYGSFTASAYYSPEYVRLGFESIFGLSSLPDRGNYLNDTQWPAIVGEAGWIGGALFVAGLVHMGIRYFRPRGESQVPLLRWLRLTGIGWLVIVVVESIAAPVFTSAPSYAFVFVAAGIYYVLVSAAPLQPKDVGNHDECAQGLD